MRCVVLWPLGHVVRAGGRGLYLLAGPQPARSGFTSTITAASVAAEIRDIKLCQITAATAARTKATLPWRVALEVLQTFRQAFFLPLLVTLVPHVVVIRGGDSLNICFNTVAVLFLLQVDNQLYEYGLSEEVKAEVEEFGRVRITPLKNGLWPKKKSAGR